MNSFEKYMSEFDLAYNQGDELGMRLVTVIATRTTIAEVEREHKIAAIMASIHAAKRAGAITPVCAEC